MWASSLSASVRGRLPGLRLAGGSTELVCADHMCMRFGEVCLCKLSIALARLQHVRHLDLSANKLERLPEVWRIERLETLDLSANKLVELPQELASMAHLKELKVAGNPLRSVPKELEPILHR